MYKIMNLIKYVEISIGGGRCCTACGHKNESGTVCDAPITKYHYNLDAICEAMQRYTGKSITTEIAQKIVDDKYQEGKSAFIMDQGDEDDSLLNLLIDRCDDTQLKFTWSEELGKCNGTEFKYYPGIPIDRHYGDWMEMWQKIQPHKPAHF